MFEGLWTYIVTVIFGDLDPSLFFGAQLYMLSLGISVGIIVIGLIIDFFDDLLEGAVEGVTELLSLDFVADMPSHGFGGLVIGAFFAAFGATGLVLTNLEVQTIYSAPLSAITSATISAIVFLVARMVFTEATTTHTSDDLIGREATVVVKVPFGGVGQIQLTHPQGVITLTAVGEADIPAGRTVTITKIVGSKAYVQEKNAQPAQ